MRNLLHLLKGYTHEVYLLIFASSIMSGVEGLLHPIFIKLIFDEGVIKGNFNRFIHLTIAYLFLGVVLNIWGLAISLWGRTLENRLLKHISRRMLEAYYHLEYNFILAKGEGYFISRIYNDTAEGVLPLVTLIRNMVSQGVMVIAFLGMLLYLSWQATLLLAAVIPFAIYTSNVFGRKIKKVTPKEREHEGFFLNILGLMIASFKTIKTFRLFPKTVEVYKKKLSEYLNLNYQNYKLARVYQTSNDMAMNVSDFLSLFVGALFVLRGTLSFGGYLAFVNTFWRTVTTLMGVFHPIPEFHRHLRIVNRLCEFESKKIKKYWKDGEEVVLKGVCFSYGSTPVLKDFTERIRTGEKVVMTGPNGSGKTTLANILAGHLTPQQGEIVLPGRVISITLPLAFPPLKVKDLVQDIKFLGEFGLSEMKEDLAYELSAGQKQKLAVAMALSQEADLYVFDEPLASVDVRSTPEMMKIILERTKGKNLVVIMHGWEEFYGYFDRVVRLEMLEKV